MYSQNLYIALIAIFTMSFLIFIGVSLVNISVKTKMNNNFIMVIGSVVITAFLLIVIFFTQMIYNIHNQKFFTIKQKNKQYFYYKGKVFLKFDIKHCEPFGFSSHEEDNNILLNIQCDEDIIKYKNGEKVK